LASAERQLVRSEASCVFCSLIRFSAWSRAQYSGRSPLGRADIDAGDDEADVEAEHRRLNTGEGAPFAIPRAGLGIAAQNRQVIDGASRADAVGDLVDFSGERLGTGQKM
jgi:hypothetical protein